MMRRTNRTAISAGLALSLLAGTSYAEVFVAPKPGQSQDAFQKDQFECHNWSQQQTGVNPSQPAQVSTAPPAQGGAVRGAGRGAAVGAIGGAIGGDAGKGAAIGAAVGAVGGRMRQNQYNRDVANANAQAQQAQQQGVQRYEQAYRTCMAGRGYQVG
jgi:hypothetical protein